MYGTFRSSWRNRLRILRWEELARRVDTGRDDQTVARQVTLVIPSPASRGAARRVIAGVDVYHQPNEVLLKILERTICSIPN